MEERAQQTREQKRNETVVYMNRVLRDCLVPDFTGKIVFSVDCRNGGIGGTQAFVQKKI